MKLAKRQNANPGAMAPFAGGYAPLSRIRNQIDRLFEDPFDWLVPTGMAGWSPAVDIYEDEDHITLKAELPGMKREDIAVSVVGDVLTLSGERKGEEEQEEGDFYRSERFYGKFERSFTLPQAVDPQKIEATYKDGVLSVRCPKTEAAKPKQIEVKSS